MNERQIKVLEKIKNDKYFPNITKCACCKKKIDITKDHWQFGKSLNDDFIYCSDKCDSWHFSILML